jgi:superfamily II DNA or RNA helicase
MKLRSYQEAAVAGVFEAWKEHQSTLLVLPTGTGKTICFAEIIRLIYPHRTLVLVHREELVWQAVKHIRAAGLETSVEMGELTEGTNLWDPAPVVVSTIQTQVAGNGGYGRMMHFKPEDFRLVIVDEAHHATSPTWRRTLNYYRQNPDLRILGVTATPDRADEQALGQVFNTVAFDYEILDAINDGYLVPIEQQMVVVEGLDFSAIRTTAGDLNGADLAAVLEAEKNLHGIASATLEIIRDMKALVFTATVKQAEMLTEIFNRHRPGMAGWACGKTPKDQRRKLLKEFSDNQRQIVVNCGLFGEGFDEPGIEVVVQARPTKSRCLYSQQVGRGTRPLPDIVDGIETAEGRRAAIAGSAKPSLLVIDFVGNAGHHKLINTADILGGKTSEEAIARATAKAKSIGQAVRMDEVLEEAEQDIRKEIDERQRREAARKAHLVAKASFSTRSINPFDVTKREPVRARGADKTRTLTEKQRAFLLRQGVNPDRLSFNQARRLLNEMFTRFRENLATPKQREILLARGVDTKELKKAEASKMIDEIAAKEGWKQRKSA